MPIRRDFRPFFNRARVLVAGGLGFIGSNLALRLHEQGAAVTLVDSLHPEYGGNRFNIAPASGDFRLSVADIRDESVLQALIPQQDYLFNLAGQTSHIDSMRNPRQDVEANVLAQLALVEACRRYNPTVRLVYAGTRQVYGRPHYLPVDERHPVHPVDVNGVNKLAGEMYHSLYASAHGLRVTVLRLTNTYGPRMRVKDDRQTFLGTWIRRLLSGEPLQVFGDGRQLRDFNFVDDVLDAMQLSAVADTAVGKTYNLGSAEVVDLVSLARRMLDIHGSGTFELLAFPDDRKRIDIGDYYGNYALIERELGWQPRVKLGSGLDRTLAYFDRYREHYWP